MIYIRLSVANKNINVFIFQYGIKIPIFDIPRVLDYLQKVERLLILPPIMLSLTACKLVNSADYYFCCVLLYMWISSCRPEVFQVSTTVKWDFNASIIQAVRPVEKRCNRASCYPADRVTGFEPLLTWMGSEFVQRQIGPTHRPDRAHTSARSGQHHQIGGAYR